MTGRSPGAVGPHPSLASGLPEPLSNILDRLCCPECGHALKQEGDDVACTACRRIFACRRNVVDLRPTTSHTKSEFQDWTKHWAPTAQQSIPQRFFSLYRKAVFARTVAYFVHRYFPAEGVLVEAGSGTSETSIRIDKRRGGRMLVAVDIVPEVLDGCAEVMDVRLGGDIFRLPFVAESVDGIWNVGVMEHFTHDKIDAILREMYRVLRPGGRIILLWPASNSIPQKLLRATERVINLARRGDRFQFHPDEISKLRSRHEALDVMTRNGIEPLEVEFGWRSLMAFRTVVGQRPATPSNAHDMTHAQGSC